ncbi:predicted protein [Chaetoceros tenuissimus]|uniref:MYND-type domain-containing protein n=1 Tax=Chaetoceros tenuissimus TaxID=426638 RepID=A0AAD3H1Y8_9STRA|nr:predicted protein [Chaetoceros tenuissimus]
MGKKGKRSNKNDARKEAEKILKESDKLVDGALDDMMEDMFSKGINRYREAIRLLESKKELMVYTRGRCIIAYYLLMYHEYKRRNYKEAIDCYNKLMAHSVGANSKFIGIVSLYYQLIMLRNSSQECQLSDFIHNITLANGTMTSTDIWNICIGAISAFRAHKLFDSAIGLELTCGSLVQSPHLSKISLALTYLEQYRVEFRQRSQMRKDDIRRIISLMDSLVTEKPPFEGYAYFDYCLVLAQCYYLTSTQTAQEEKRTTRASKFVEQFLSALTDEDGSKIAQDRCFTCDQAVTSDEVQFVCSGCRVACYCSINHQRATWKREAVQGTRIGHEILCPLYKAFRKYKLQEVSKDRDKEKEAKAKRRLEKECVKFLADGLGLKNKCFPREYCDSASSVFD